MLEALLTCRVRMWNGSCSANSRRLAEKILARLHAHEPSGVLRSHSSNSRGPSPCLMCSLLGCCFCFAPRPGANRSPPARLHPPLSSRAAPTCTGVAFAPAAYWVWWADTLPVLQRQLPRLAEERSGIFWAGPHCGAILGRPRGASHQESQVVAAAPA